MINYFIELRRRIYANENMIKEYHFISISFELKEIRYVILHSELNNDLEKNNEKRY